MVKKYKERSGLSSIGVAAIAVYEEIVNGEPRGDAKFNYEIQADTVVVTITGKAVFLEDIITNSNQRTIKFVCNPGSYCTILSKLSVSDIYLRIKNYYNIVLYNCLNKTAKEQQKFLFGENHFLSLSSGLIEESEVYIRNLPIKPNNIQLKDLILKIEKGILEYANHAKDEYGVEMVQYAKALENKL
jgi:hypothetical protein